jgi:phosphatidylinositol-4,5-bisphosphate 4-phosphatase
MNQEAMVWLFGPQQIQEHTGSIEGLVGDYLLQLRNRINRLQTNLAELNPQSLEHQETHNQMAELQLQHERILVLSHQVLSIFLNENYKTTGNEPYKIVARLAILCNWIGVQVAFNCKSGKDRTGMLDSEIKFLIARICQEGIIPEPDAMLSAEQSNMLFNFCINSGSHEVQELNTGIRGYKQDNSQTPKRLGGASISRYVRGPSEFVAN